MIGFLSGRVVDILSEKQIILKTPAGIGYIVFHRPGIRYTIGEHVDIFILHVIREDSEELFGFESIEDRRGVEKLLTVDGVGPKTAANIIYSLSWKTIENAIAQEDYKTLSSMKGLGTKTAKKIVLELKGAKTSLENLSENTIQTDQTKRIVEAIVAMGYTKKEVQSAVNSLAQSPLFDSNNTVQSIKQVLKRLSS